MDVNDAAIVGSSLAATIAFSWYVASTLEKTRESVRARTILLNEALRSRLQNCHARYRERIGSAQLPRAKKVSIRELQEKEEFENRAWSQALDLEWEGISRTFRYLFVAKQTSQLWCFYGAGLSYGNMGVSVLGIIELTTRNLPQYSWLGLKAYAHYAYLGLGLSMAVSLFCLFVALHRDRKLEKALNHDV